MRCEHLSIGIGWSTAVREAEDHARAVMRGSETRWPWGDAEKRYQWWVDVFGASEDEFEDMADALARRYHRVPFWRRGRRRALMSEYVKINAPAHRRAGPRNGMAMSQLGIDGQVQPERVCACPCKRSLDGMRSDAVWYSRACAVAWRRNHPGESLYAARSTNVGRTRSRCSGEGGE